MRTLKGIVMGSSVLLIFGCAGPAWAITLPNLPLELTTPPDNSFNRLSLTLDLQPAGFSNKSQTKTSDATGDCSADFEILFDPTTRLANASGINFNLQQPGQITLSDTHFSFSWLLGLVTENIDATGIKTSLYTPAPPTPVGGGQFAADQQAAQFNNGSLVYSGVAGGSYDLSANPLDGQNTGTTSPGTIVISNPSINGNLANYTVTVQVPFFVDQTLTDPSYTARVRANGTLQASGSFAFDFGPRTVYWNATGGDFDLGGNWDTGFAPRTGDTAAIENGGTATLSTIFPNTPAVVRVDNGSTLALADDAQIDASSPIVNNATFEIASGNHSIGAISGTGITQLDDSTQLIVSGISQDSLTIGNSAKLIIQPITANSPLGSAIANVPEPSNLVLLGAAFLMLIYARAKKSRK